MQAIYLLRFVAFVIVGLIEAMKNYIAVTGFRSEGIGPITAFNKVFAEIVSDLKNYIGFLVTNQFLIIAPIRNEIGHGIGV